MRRYIVIGAFAVIVIALVQSWLNYMLLNKVHSPRADLYLLIFKITAVLLVANIAVSMLTGDIWKKKQ
jgi:hypothetical protein